MSRNRIVPGSEQSNQYSPASKKSTPAAVHSPRRGLIAGPNTNKLHPLPVAVAVSPTGERTICPVEAVNIPRNIGSTNPFASENKEAAIIVSSSEEIIQKLPSKKQKARLHRRRKLQEKERQRTAKLILTQRISARPKQQVEHKTTSAQTDPAITGISRPPEYVGDPGKPNVPGYELSLSARPIYPFSELSYSNKKLASIDKFFAQLMPESLKILTSFMIMIILIFWLTSIILDVEVPSDFFRMASNYVRSFKWGYYRKEPQTNAEKCLEYLTKLFK